MGNTNPVASGSALIPALRLATMLCHCSSGVFRSSQGSRRKIAMPPFDCDPVMTLKPETVVTVSIPGVACAMSVTFSSTACVRHSDAPSGN